MQEHVYEPCARTDGGINILKDGEVLWESPSTDTPYTPHDWENALLVCVTLSGNEKPAERALAPQASGESQAQTASLKQQAEPSDAKERGDDYLRELAAKLAKDSMWFFYDPPTKTACFDQQPEVDWEKLEKATTADILTALQAVQRAERAKARGLREALEAIERHQRLCMEGTASLSTTWRIANNSLAAYDSATSREGVV